MSGRAAGQLPRAARAALASVLLAGAAVGTADLPPRPARPARAGADAVAVVPEQFLRRWDPITLFFPDDRGPAAGGAEDRPEAWAALEPRHAGAWTWLDARTLQFQPADPWPALARFTLRAAGRSFRLATLMAAPLASRPEAGATGLAPIEEIALTFAEPLPVEALARALVIEVRPLPALGGEPARFLSPDDFEIKALERAAPADPATYVLRLRQPVPMGRKVFVRFRLTLEESAERAVAEISFATDEPFRALRFGCRTRQAPVAPEGARYSAEQALACEADEPAIVVDFSAAPRDLTAVVARNLVRVSPAVPGLEAALSGRRLELTGEFQRETAYRVTLVPTPLDDERGRGLDLAAANELWLSFGRQRSYLRLAAASGVAERYGPKMIPLAGRGDERLDLRIHRIDALDRSFWPFPEQPVTVDEAARPPGPGERAPAWTSPETDPPAAEIARRIAALGSPPVSRLVDLPLRRDAGSATFGLDLSAPLADLAGPDAPGTYLVGIRRLGAETARSWMRLEVTDLSLSTLEESARTVFVVTSLASARPVAGAEIRVEGARREGNRPWTWVELFRAKTDAAGRATWPAPGAPDGARHAVRRVVVSAGPDRLVLDPARPPDTFADASWTATPTDWLQWTQETLEGRAPEPDLLAHVFPERPVYRPEEPVHLKAWLRRRAQGRLEPVRDDVLMVVEGPGTLVWRFPLEPGPLGGVYLRFEEKELPTGTYRVRIEEAGGEPFQGTASFRKEAYRLPRFEVRLDAPERAALDREFKVSALATYYAGGRLAARPIEWRVTQFPYAWTPAERPGFLFSSDARFARDRRFESTPALERAATTDEDGGAELVLNPAIEPTAQPRTYVIEATVVDADEQTVTATRQVVALPPLLVGVKVPRYVERADRIRPEVLVVGPDDRPLAGQPVKVRLVHRQWHSYLRASDFSDGVARYVTEVVEEPVSETSLTSGDGPVAVELTLPGAGVYVVELEAADRLGRAQTVAVDLFAGGEQPVTWSKPASAVFQVVPDAARYRPGQRARLVLESPFQSGEALVAVETPDGNRYSWLPVRGGKAVFELPVEAHWTPRVPVHFLLLRGRLEDTRPVPGSATDLGRPATFGATVWLEVEPVALQVQVELDLPQRARPRDALEVGIRLSDPDGAPLAGEVALWLVDQAVLSLGREARLDPVPSFLAAVRSLLEVRDTRSLVFGFLPFARQPGGGEGEEAAGLLDRQTIRRNFQPVPFYEPAIPVGPDGVARVTVRLADDLTRYKVRAKAAAGDERFGVATGEIEVRQPVVLQPALPRFVRPGDRFTASAVGRIVEGDAGPGSAEARFAGLTPAGETRRAFEWVPDRATRLDFPVAVPTPGYDEQGRLARHDVAVTIGAQRAADGAGDAFEVRLPLRDDRERVRLSNLVRVEPGVPLALPEPAEPARAGTLRRSLLVAAEPGIVELAAGLDFLLAYPYGCTEQRLSTARAQVALARFRDLLGLEGGEGELARAVGDTAEWLALVQQESGLVAFWPGGTGSVALTAWAVEFLAEAKEAGLPVDATLQARALAALEAALRSDYTGFLAGEAWSERTWALRALARAGRFDLAYGNELARKAQFLDLENVASVLTAFERAGRADSPALPPLEEVLWGGTITRLHQGREIYGGLEETRSERSPLVLPTETRTLATMVQALAQRASTPAEEAKLKLLVDALVGLGKGDGWGTTNANAAAIAALAERLAAGQGAGGAATLSLAAPDGERELALGPGTPTARWVSTAPGRATLTLAPGGAASVVARAQTSYLPAEDGSRAPARREGFVVAREALVVAGGGAPPERRPIDAPGTAIELTVAEVVEEHVQVVNPQERHYVAVVVPLAAGMEPLNPALETAPPEAKPAGRLTAEPTYVAFLDDQVAFFYDTLPAGTYDFWFRTRAQIPGSFVQPPAKAEMMYDGAVVGSSPGARITIAPKPD